MKKLLFTFITIAFLSLSLSNNAYAQESVAVFFNDACTDCVTYIKEITPLLSKYDINPVLKDYINKPSYRKELNTLNKKYQIPYSVQDSLTFFLKQNLVIEGHVPQKVVETLLKNYKELPKHNLIVLFQPKMHSDATDYQIYISGYSTDKLTTSDDILAYIKNKEPRVLQNSQSNNILIPVIVGAVSNSLHPCAIAVLLLLLTFLYSIKKGKRTIILMGFSYIIGVFLVYFLIGLGLLRAISLSSEPFFVAKIATVLLLFLGLINIKDYFFPKLPIHLKIPDFTKGAIQSFMEKASIPSAFIVGALVGMCAFPCTGGIYTVIISTLAATASIKFIIYLMLYNIVFVLPLIIVVFIATNRNLLEKVEDMEHRNSRKLHLITGILMVAIAISVYFWIRMYL
ncbi:MAG: cytochrome c biogenesis protein, transmembrane region [uncultured bacterium]|nr:MAG: cytochrome c biogenesis protein, transmembrane region [uncultured bacterium]